MSHTETEPHAPATPSSPAVRKAPRPNPPAKRGFGVRAIVTLLALGAVVGALYYAIKTDLVSGPHLVELIKKQLPMHLLAKKLDPATVPIELAPTEAWDGSVTLNPKEKEAIGLHVGQVRAQTEPLKLSLTGRTDYDQNSLTRVRPRFDALVEKVYVSQGQKVKKGDPLVDLYSIDLAAAKTDYQTKYVQWQHDLKLLRLDENLMQAVPPSISRQHLIDSQIAESKTRLDYITSRDKLGILGVPADQVDPLIEGLDSNKSTPIPYENVQNKAKMTLRSPADGIVIERDVVPGNVYNDTLVLMVIAPLDHLFVWVNAYERDQGKVALGQGLEILFPFLDESVKSKVEYVSSEVSKDTRAVKIRASVPNKEGHLKADMLVKAWLEIPAVAGQTLIPRLAMVVANGSEYVFVRDPKEVPTGAGNVTKFERRLISVSQEGSEDVVVAKGLKAGEVVATNGSLILAQLYEDRQVVDNGMPSK